jgi:hypothetical protein
MSVRVSLERIDFFGKQLRRKDLPWMWAAPSNKLESKWKKKTC